MSLLVIDKRVQLSYEEVVSALLVPLKENEIVKLLKELNEIFTTSRNQIGSYIESRKMVAAYTCFYLPTNMPKFSFLMKQIPPEIIGMTKDSHFVDIGTGPGTYLVSALDHFGDEHFGSMVGIDQSKEMLAQAKKCMDTFFSRSPQLYFEKDANSSSLSFLKEAQSIFLNFGNSINEMGIDKGIDLIDHLDPKFISIIEPGTFDVSRELIKLRKILIDRGYSVLFPCVGEASCSLSGDRESDWCHQVLRLSHDPSVERLGQLIGRNRRNMPMSAYFYVKNTIKEKKDEVDEARFFRFLRESKFAFEWEVCISIEGDNRIIEFEILKKSLSRKEIKMFKSAHVGGKILFEKIKVLSESRWRVKCLDYNGFNHK